MKTILIMAGGTGGHVYPALSVAKSLMNHGIGVVWLGTRSGLESSVVPGEGIDMEWIDVHGIRRSGWLRKIGSPVMLVRAMLQVYTAISRRKPIAVLGMGGFVAGPGGLVAWLMRLPLLIHEANARAGITNRLLAPIARRVMCGFPDTPGLGPRVEWTGNPVREPILSLPIPEERYDNRQDRVLHILVVGGSQGALVLNQVVPEAMAELTPDQRPKVLHQCGRDRAQELFARYRELDIEADVREFIDDMAAAYYQADLVVCRAGAMTVAEICAAGLAAVLVPYPYAAGNHQHINAQYLVSQGAAIALEESDLSANLLARTVKKFQDDRARLLSIAQKARALGRPDAIGRVTGRCLEVVSA